MFMNGEWSLPKMYLSDSFALRRFVSCFRLNSIWSLPIKKCIDEAEVYECIRCQNRFNKKLTWKHFIYECPLMPRCVMISQPDPLSTTAFRLANTLVPNEFTERIITILSLANKAHKRNVGVSATPPSPSP